MRRLEREIDDGALLDPPSAIEHAARHVHGEVERPEALAALRRAPHHDEAAARNEALHQVRARGRRRYLIEAREGEAPFPAVPVRPPSVMG
jgi:hypothetical protein